MTPTIQKTSRFAAIETLVRLERTRYPVKPLFDTVSEECGLLGPARGLAMNFIYGVLRQRQYLNLLLEKLCNRSIAQLDPLVHAALLVGLYQLFCLDRIPESAAVNETVNALKAAGQKKHLQGFVNGVLRAAIRKRQSLPATDAKFPFGNSILNHPEWLTSRWQQRFGQEEMERICAVNNCEPQLVLRVNCSRISRQQLMIQLKDAGIPVHIGNYAPDSLVLPSYHGSITSIPGYEEGYFQVQDEAAQLAVLLLGPFSEQDTYLDACAGIGGKTSYIIQMSHHKARVAAIEPEPQRQRLLQENISRLFPERSITICKSSLQDYCRTSRQQFSRVLVDAPCSGTGVIGRHPDIRWNRILNDLSRYQLTQYDILKSAAELVSPEGILVYATCSLEIEENQEVVDLFLQHHHDFHLTACQDYLPANVTPFIDGNYFNPHPRVSIDGFFAARLQRTATKRSDSIPV